VSDRGGRKRALQGPRPFSAAHVRTLATGGRDEELDHTGRVSTRAQRLAADPAAQARRQEARRAARVKVTLPRVSCLERDYDDE
jgi:hypothetical protein